MSTCHSGSLVQNATTNLLTGDGDVAPRRNTISLCRFLNGTRPTYRGDDLKPMPVQITENRPDKMYLMRGVNGAIEMHQLGAESIGL